MTRGGKYTIGHILKARKTLTALLQIRQALVVIIWKIQVNIFQYQAGRLGPLNLEFPPFLALTAAPLTKNIAGLAFPSHNMAPKPKPVRSPSV